MGELILYSSKFTSLALGSSKYGLEFLSSWMLLLSDLMSNCWLFISAPLSGWLFSALVSSGTYSSGSSRNS